MQACKQTPHKSLQRFRPIFADILSLLHQRDAAWIEPMALKKKLLRSCCWRWRVGKWWKMSLPLKSIETWNGLGICLHKSKQKNRCFWLACANSSSLASRSFEISSCKRRLAASPGPTGLPSWLDPASKRVEGGPVSLQRLETWQSWIHQDEFVIFDA